MKEKYLAGLDEQIFFKRCRAYIKEEFYLIKTPQEAKVILSEGNKNFVDGLRKGNISLDRRNETAVNGQQPYAIILACSDSRVPVEHIFCAGIGDLFVIRNAGNLVGDFALGSMEYAAEHLGVPLLVVLGHNKCGAIASALDGEPVEGWLGVLLNEVKSAIAGAKNATDAEDMNIRYGVSKIMQSPVIAHLVKQGQLEVIGAKYDIITGKVEFWD